MPSNWTKGFTKYNHPSIKKISDTMKRKKVDNFTEWRKKMKLIGKIPSYSDFQKDGDLAELIGVVLGDGHLSKFPRTEELTVFSNGNNRGFIDRYADLFRKFFSKDPYIAKINTSNCVRIRIYQKEIQRRLSSVPYSPRRDKVIVVPRWILSRKEHVIRYLRGLYEAEGSFCIHKPTGTYKFLFSNRNSSLLKIVRNGMKKLGFHPHLSGHQVQISRKEEVYKAIELLGFRKY